MAKATFFVQVEPIWSRYTNREGERALTGIKAERITKSRPRQPLGGTVTVKLTLQIPDGAFFPLKPEAVVVVPDSFVLTNVVEVVADDPSVRLDT